MRAISTNQPWASLLLRKVKPHETRSWPAPPHLFGQRIAICASKKRTADRFAAADPFIAALLQRIDLPLADLPYGKVVGVMTLAGSLPMTPAFIAEQSEGVRRLGRYEPGMFAWVFTDPEPFTICPPVQGKLGFFEWEPQ